MNTLIIPVPVIERVQFKTQLLSSCATERVGRRLGGLKLAIAMNNEATSNVYLDQTRE